MIKVQQNSVIPQFSLYGESSLNKDPGFVHIEDIADRSSENGWLIKPHRHGKMHQILCMFEGTVDVQLDDHSYHLPGTWAINIPPGVVHGFRFSPATEGVVLTLAEPILADQSQEKSQQIIDHLTHVPQTIEFNKKNALLNQLTQYLILIKEEIKNSNSGQQLMLEWLVRMVLITLKRQSDHSLFSAANSQTSSNLLNDFRQLLEQHYRQQWKVQQYASALNISVSSLNRLCNETIGVATKNIILDRVLIEAKRKLIYTREPLDQIAYALGFKDPAYFSRFFKKMEKVAPSTYRNENNYDTTSH
jgi:AraC family transcriptional activator of pobA